MFLSIAFFASLAYDADVPIPAGLTTAIGCLAQKQRAIDRANAAPVASVPTLPTPPSNPWLSHGADPMCGMAGFVNTNGAPADARLIRRIRHLITHRGPDAWALTCADKLLSGHRRLSIIDLAAGLQPMSNEDDSLWITYNGEIFNHANIRPELEAGGHRYKSHCDTETIVHAYEQ